LNAAKTPNFDLKRKSKDGFSGGDGAIALNDEQQDASKKLQ
jgi:hypothetical protein